jgi:hypothetical protein
MTNSYSSKVLCIVLHSFLLFSCSSSQATVSSTPTVSPVSQDEWVKLIPEREKQSENTLVFTITPTLAGCVLPGDHIPIEMTFKNRAINALTFRAHFVVSPSSEHPHPDFTIFSEIISVIGNNSLIYGPVFIDRISNPPDIGEFIQIPFQTDYKSTLSFDFPAKIYDGSNYVVMSPGKYTFKLFYINKFIGSVISVNPLELDDLGAWVGQLASNQIEICIAKP